MGVNANGQCGARRTSRQAWCNGASGADAANGGNDANAPQSGKYAFLLPKSSEKLQFSSPKVSKSCNSLVYLL